MNELSPSTDEVCSQIENKTEGMLSKLKEMLDSVLKMRVRCAKLKMDLKNIYSDKQLQELNGLNEVGDPGEGPDPRYVNMIRELSAKDISEVDLAAIRESQLKLMKKN